ncbi:MAG TPA: hypothetical protein VHX86_01195 [Tepidisphaeraceae bacterium]|nr:hypothetical protein [Tepidisphaeraceae bacterium]
MSQYPFPPPPYSPPVVDPAAWASAQPNAAGRAAALWQFILGGVIFLGGTCAGLLVFMPDNLMNEVARQQQRNLQPINNLTPVQEIRLIATIGSGTMLVAGGLLLLLAFFVRRGGKVSTIFSMVLNGVIALFLGMSLLGDLLQLGSNPMVVMPLLLSIGVLGLCIVTIVKLSAALKSAGANQAQAMQQAYYWMMQQQQAAGGSGQAGYGYGQGYPPPPNPPAPPTSPENSNPPQPPGDAGQA